MNKKYIFIFTGLLASLFGVCCLQGQRVSINNIDYGQRSTVPFYSSGATANNSNSTAEVVLGTSSTISGGFQGSNGVTEINILADCDVGSVNQKFILVREAGTLIHTFQMNASDRWGNFQLSIANRNDPASQVTIPNVTTDQVWQVWNAPCATFSINTAVDHTITISSSNTVATDSVNLRGWSVNIYRAQTVVP